MLLQVLNGLAKALQNKKLLVAANANLDRLCGTLCSMVRSTHSYSVLFTLCKIPPYARRVVILNFLNGLFHLFKQLHSCLVMYKSLTTDGGQ